ncbi:glutathione transferase GstA [Telluria aromaticivorans]|uniref:Glutathione transferase GstA n=1 Tax=Telluria aromaticivorans TaxID=2725995 RepID=A0A7Y2NYP5_9BURK|nr:glutathione transferase GstA [Telluria aromaticivorans]NNG23037.1 glutathione transferase GstA [Telluria aromaticivorans]
MKLYVSPGACSLAPHIALNAAGLPFTVERVSLKTKAIASGGDFRDINAKGSVPALQLDDGKVLTEAAVLLQYIADQAPAAQLAPALGSFERYQLMEWLNYLASELHKRFTPIFTPGCSEEGRAAAWAGLARPLNYIAGKLDGGEFLMGSQFTIADAYLFTVLNWVGFARFSLADWPTLQAYQARVAALPAVQQALRAEGLA